MRTPAIIAPDFLYIALTVFDWILVICVFVGLLIIIIEMLTCPEEPDPLDEELEAFADEMCAEHTKRTHYHEQHTLPSVSEPLL